MIFPVSNASLQDPLTSLHEGLFQKWSTLDPKKFYAILFQKLVFLVSLYPELLEEKNKEIKKSRFLVNS